MKTKQITQETAQKIFPHLNDEGKKIFKDQYPDFFISNSLEEACKKLGVKLEDEIPFPQEKTNRHKKANAFTKLDILREAHGNYPNLNERKWYPIFNTTKSGLVFSFTYCEYWVSYADADVGSPFVFKTSDEAAEFGRTNIELYNAAFTL